MKNIIEVKNVSFSYPNNLVLQNVSLSFHEGDFAGIIGKNGSGKSTLLKLMLGQLKPSGGKIEVDKTKKIGYVEQVTLTSDSSFPANVKEIVMLGLYGKIGMFKFANKHHKRLVSSALATVGMQGFEHKQLNLLSGGQQQKVLIAKALVSNPDILILDEPTTGIDKDSEAEFMKLLEHLNTAHKKTIILVTHNYSKLAASNKVFLLEDKTIKENANV